MPYRRGGGHKSKTRYRSSVLLLLCAAPVITYAQTFTTLVNFSGTNGANPANVALVQGTSGNLYGTTQNGGVTGIGTVFEMTPSGKLANLYSFLWSNGQFAPQGEYPYAGLVQATNGTFYGTTFNGGNNYPGGNFGTIFKITPGGTLTTLHSFAGYPTDGAYPTAGLVQATNGDFYGTTQNGGSFGNYGTIFKITPAGTLTILHSFNGTDGYAPSGGLIQATNGNLYGTTSGGGISNTCGGGCGTVFRITPGGTLTTLHSFGLPDGGFPTAGLVQAADGRFYGTTSEGGTSLNCDSGCGTVFTISGGGMLTTLYSFGLVDGRAPDAALIQGTDGNFYGTTQYGGAYDVCRDAYGSGCGTVFKITPSGILTTLHSFDLTDGASPYGGLVQSTNGSFYGTTSGNPSDGEGDGTVFRLSTGFGPFVKTVPSSGRLGAAIKILGTNLTGATSVTFNGITTAFTIVSPSLITTTVPAGATSGKVQVTIPGSTLSGNAPFQVLP